VIVSLGQRLIVRKPTLARPPRTGAHPSGVNHAATTGANVPLLTAGTQHHRASGFVLGPGEGPAHGFHGSAVVIKASGFSVSVYNQHYEHI
jgi:hypothetical protein